MKNKLALIVMITLLSGILGCTKMDQATAPIANAPILVAPADGATSVRLDESIVFTFAKSVDRKIVEQSVRLISERAMTDSLCPVSTTMGHGRMDMAMMDSMKMNHLMEIHSSPGKFTWNGNSTLCTFTPDSMMYPNMDYMIHMDGDMMRMMANRMGDNMSMMSGHGKTSMKDDMIYHFRTLDTTSTGGGHGGHH